MKTFFQYYLKIGGDAIESEREVSEHLNLESETKLDKHCEVQLENIREVLKND